MLAPKALLLLVAFVACAGPGASSSEAEPPVPSRQDALVASIVFMLSDTTSKDEMRAILEEGLEEKELNHIGFDQVTIAQCVEGVIAAEIDRRQRPGDPVARDRFAESVDALFAAKQEAYVRRDAGKASCIPTIR